MGIYLNGSISFYGNVWFVYIVLSYGYWLWVCEYWVWCFCGFLSVLFYVFVVFVVVLFVDLDLFCWFYWVKWCYFGFV